VGAAAQRGGRRRERGGGPAPAWARWRHGAARHRGGSVRQRYEKGMNHAKPT
jgi:hypothetical protein